MHSSPNAFSLLMVSSFGGVHGSPLQVQCKLYFAQNGCYNAL